MAKAETKSEEKVEGEVSAAKNVKKTTKKACKSVKKDAKKVRKSVKTTTTQKKKTVKKGGRKADGTFDKGNKPKITENYGRPQSDFSHRAMAKVRAKKNPQSILNDLDTLDKIISDPDASAKDKMRAIDIKIRLNMGYDPTEQKDVSEKPIAESPLNALTIDELRSLKALKQEKK